MNDELTDRDKARIDKHFNIRVRQLYFSPKTRAAEKNRFLDILRRMKALWPTLGSMPEEERGITSTLTSFCSTMLGIVLDAEKWSEGRRLRNKRFILWKHVFRNEYLVSFMFFKLSEGIHKQGSIIFPDGLPKPGKPVISHFYRHACATLGYREVGRGTFYQKFTDITTVAYTLKGADRTIRFYLVDKNNKREELTAYALRADS